MKPQLQKVDSILMVSHMHNPDRNLHHNTIIEACSQRCELVSGTKRAVVGRLADMVANKVLKGGSSPTPSHLDSKLSIVRLITLL